MSEFLELTGDLNTAINQLNQVLQGDENATVMINGEEKPSVQKKTLDTVNAQVQFVLDAAADIDSVKYANTAAGLSATFDTQFFSVVSSENHSYLDLYKNENGVAVFIKSYPSSYAVNESIFMQRERISASDFLSQSINLFDQRSSVRGFAVSSTGQIVESASSSISDFIEVKPNTIYTKSGIGQTFITMSEYDIYKRFIRRRDFSADSPVQITTSSDAYFVILTMTGTGSVGYRVFSEGSSVPPYSLYKKSLSEQALPIFDGNRIELNSVPAESVSFIENSKNLFTYEDTEIGFYIDEYGVKQESATYRVSKFIRVKPSTEYSKSGDGAVFVSFALYDFNKQFLRRVNTDLTTEDGEYFVRVNYQGSTSAERMLSEGSEPLPYEPNIKVLKGVVVPPESVQTDTLADDAVTEDKASFIKQGVNLFNPALSTLGYAITSDGSIAANGTVNISDFIKIASNSIYTKSGTGIIFQNVIEYDKNKLFLRRLDWYQQAPSQIQISPDTRFIRLNISGNPSTGNRMLTQGTEVHSYEPYRHYLHGVDLYEKKPLISDGYMLDTPLDGVFSTAETYDYLDDFSNITSAEVYQLYENLMLTNPSYIKKQVLGDDLYGNEIALYKFIPETPSVGATTKPIKIFITLGTHGYEHASGMSGYLFFKNLADNWADDNKLEALRHNVQFLVIPVVNPSGWDDFTRKNRNGVDINRNFPEGWDQLPSDPTSNTYKGPSPLSEVESQYVSQVFDEHPDISIMYDYHNFSGDANTDYFIWIPTAAGTIVKHMAQMLIQRMTRKWRKDFSWIPSDDDWFAGYCDSTHGAMIQDHAFARGIEFSATFETSGRWWLSDDPTPYNSEHKVTSVEAFTNWIMININELIKASD